MQPSQFTNNYANIIINNMTPKEKAKELVDKFTVVGLQQTSSAHRTLLCHGTSELVPIVH